MTDPRRPSTRDAALRRLHRVNRWLIAGSVALTGVFAEAAASAFPGHSKTKTDAVKRAGNSIEHSSSSASSGPVESVRASRPGATGHTGNDGHTGGAVAGIDPIERIDAVAGIGPRPGIGPSAGIRTRARIRTGRSSPGSRANPRIGPRSGIGAGTGIRAGRIGGLLDVPSTVSRCRHACARRHHTTAGHAATARPAARAQAVRGCELGSARHESRAAPDRSAGARLRADRGRTRAGCDRSHVQPLSRGLGDRARERERRTRHAHQPAAGRGARRWPCAPPR